MDAQAPARRVAVVLEQCWHEVPGGTARAAIDAVAAVQEATRPPAGAGSAPPISLVGVSARHPSPPPEPWVPPLPVRQLPLPRLALYEAWHDLRWPPVQRATGPVDVIHATGVVVPPRTAPLVVTVNDLAFVHEPDHFTRWGLRFFRRALALTRRDADLVVCPSQATLDDCLAHGFEAHRLRLVPYGIHVDPVPGPTVAEVRRRYGLPGRYVAWVGTVEPRKNLPALLQAFAALPAAHDDVGLVLVGPTGWREDLDALVGPLGGRVRRTGFLPDRELAAVVAGAEVFCLPSLREGFGIPVLEAMAQGTPVITSAGTSTAELVGSSGAAGLLVDPRSPAELAGALHLLLDDRTEAERLGRAGQERARTVFPWSATAEGLLAAYAEVAP